MRCQLWRLGLVVANVKDSTILLLSIYICTERQLPIGRYSLKNQKSERCKMNNLCPECNNLC